MNKWRFGARLLAGLPLVGAALLLTTLLSPAHAADDSKVSREREMLRRAQEALRQSEAEKSDLTRAKLDSEQKLKTLSQELETAKSGSKAGQSAQAALRSQLQSATAQQADLQAKLADAARQIAALNQKQHETEGQLASRDTEIKRLQQDLQTSKTTEASCETKNRQLYTYSQDILDKYKRKGVWSAMAQKEPVFGFKEVGIENTVQEYHDKLKSQRIPDAPPAAAVPAAAAPPPTAAPANATPPAQQPTH